jgi:hypothetical protein
MIFFFENANSVCIYVCMYVVSSSLRQATEGSRCGDAEGGPTCGQDDQSGANRKYVHPYSYIPILLINLNHVKIIL